MLGLRLRYALPLSTVSLAMLFYGYYQAWTN